MTSALLAQRSAVISNDVQTRSVCPARARAAATLGEVVTQQQWVTYGADEVSPW
jgi:hypothetical protein